MPVFGFEFFGMNPPDSAFFDAVVSWLNSDSTIESAVLYGSTANPGPAAQGLRDNWSDIDLHVVAASPATLFDLDWSPIFPGYRFCLSVTQEATGSTKKITALFVGGQIDVVVVTKTQMKLVRWAMRLGMHRKIALVRTALNEMATSMCSGYRFLKGERVWGDVYKRVVREMAGVRLRDAEICDLANAFLVNALLTRKRLDRGELMAAQYSLHRQLSETNFRLVRELRLRRGLSLPSFGLGRRAEMSFSPTELSWVRVNARLDRDELAAALRCAFEGLKSVTLQLVPAWRVPPGYNKLLEPDSSDLGQSGSSLTPAH